MRKPWSSLRCQWKTFIFTIAMPSMLRLDNVDGLEVAAHVDHEAAPAEARLVLDVDERKVVAVGVAGDELRKGLHAAQRADCGVGLQRRVGGVDGQRIGLVFAKLGIGARLPA